LSRVHLRYRRQTTDRQTTDGRTTTYSEREHEFTFAKNVKEQQITVFLVQMDILVRTKRTKIVTTRHVFWAQNIGYQKRFTAGLSLSCLINSAPNPTAEFGGRSVAERGGSERKLERKRKGEKGRRGESKGDGKTCRDS